MKRLLAGAVVLALLGGVAQTWSSPSPAEAAPGNPGAPQPGVPLFVEDFQSSSSTTAVGIDSYVGASGMRYTADAAWLPSAQACNGWVTSSSAPVPSDPGCASVWTNRVGPLAKALGVAQGMSSPATNNALTAYTNRTSGNTTGYAGTMLKTSSGIPATAGHYYAVSAYFGEASCELQPAGASRLTFYLIENGVERELQSGLQPCVVGTVDRGPDPTHATPPATPTAAQKTAMQDDVWIAHLTSAALQLPTLPAGSAQTDLGFRLYNATDTGTGNDLVFDLPQIVDVTPQLDKAFSPVTITKGETSTLTYTITNTSEKAAKSGWSFTDVLPTGLTAVGSPTTGSSTGACVGFTGSVTSGRVVVSGSLADGQAFCTVSLQVTASVGGYYSNGPSNFPASTSGPACNGGPGVGLCGLNAPAVATLTVLPVLVDDSATTPYLTPVTVAVLDNDVAVAAGSTVSRVQPDDPARGTWTVNVDGTVTFRPAAGFDGVAAATYTVTFPDATTGTARVVVTVLPPPPPITQASAATGITGTGVPGNNVTVTLPDGSTVTATVAPDGTWSIPPSRLSATQRASLTPNHSVTAVQTDPSTLNVSSPTSMPLPPSVVTGGRTASGRGIPGAVVTVTGDGTTLCTATVAADETWSCTFATPVGPQTPVLARQRHRGSTTPLSLTAATTVPTAGAGPGAGPGSGSGGQAGPGAADPPGGGRQAGPVQAKGSGAGHLASTGADLGAAAAVGVVVLLVGVGLTAAAAVLGRRRRTV